MPSQQDIDYGKLGAKYGKQGGRPSSKGDILGMATVEYNEIVALLISPQSSPVYPSRMVVKYKKNPSRNRISYFQQIKFL